MNIAFSFFILCLPILSGYPTVRGSDSNIRCLECGTRFKREACPGNKLECGHCLYGHVPHPDGSGICIEKDPSSEEDGEWSEDIAGTDGADLDKVTTTEATEQEGNGINDQNHDLEGKNGKIIISSDIESKGNKLKAKNDLLAEARRKHLAQVQKKRNEEEKLNKFLEPEEDKGGKVEEERQTNLEINSSTNPPPYIKKHKVENPKNKNKELENIYFLFIVIGCSVAGIAGLALAGYCWYKLHTTAKAVSEADYTGYTMKGSTKQPPQTQGDQKLDYSAEMYHYQQTKSQLAAMEKAGAASPKGGAIEDDEDNSDEGDEGDYTVYECPGLAPTGDMTVVNPMFSDQEAIGSDQDANGRDRSGHSSPSAPRHPISKPPE